ncbi:MAG: Glutaryl-7-ACA acylase [Labilithrix sp.]|nr:Glutaryl-7-ACA acylase [Labilithrix sp.]
MRAARLPLVFFMCLGSVACGVTSPRAVAEPRKADDALVHEALDSEAAIVRAIREHYTKYEYRIPMRDGAKLFTVAYVPKDASHTYPIMLQRTPYSVAPYGIDNYPDAKNARNLRKLAPSTAFIREGYIFVHQDVRGRQMSEGTFVDVRPHATTKGGIDESTDAWDTIDWIVKNVPQNNGRVGSWGISYPGFYAAQTAVDAHPALKAVSPQAPVTDWFMGDDFHHNGAFFLADSFDFYASFGKVRPKPTKKSTWGFDHDVADVYDYFLALGPLANAHAKYVESGIADGIPFWNEMMSHPTRDDWWKARDPRPFYKNVKPAVMTVGGWFDAEDCFGALETYRAFEKQSPGAENVLVMGPWSHGGWARNDGDRHGDITFGQKASLHYREQIELPFFRRHLKGDGKGEGKGQGAIDAFVFETGTNVWQTYSAWPPRDAKKVTLHFHAGGKLGAGAPAAREDGEGFDAYVSDPARPVPYRAKTSASIESDYMTDDQRFATRRPDVLTYSTGELDADVAFAGPLEAKLWVSTTGTDADFVVKLVDGYPQDHAELGGYQQLVRAEIMRGKFRNSFEKPEPFEPGKPVLVHFTLPDVGHTFRTGHRIIVQVQSSWFPLVDRNPQTFTDIYKATEADFHIATHRVFRTPDKASSLEVTIARGTLPR